MRNIVCVCIFAAVFFGFMTQSAYSQVKENPPIELEQEVSETPDGTQQAGDVKEAVLKTSEEPLVADELESESEAGDEVATEEGPPFV
jgi:hypothetical protein